MESECKVILDATVDTEARKQTTQSNRLSSKLTTALLAFTLCLAAAAAVLVFNSHTKGTGQEKDHFGEYNPDMKNSVEWKSHVDQSHSQGGLELNNNEIVIPQNGLYFIYSQASFRVSCSSSDTDDSTSKPMVHLSHTVQRWSSSYGTVDGKKVYQTILHSVRTACQKTDSSEPDQEGSWFSAVYMGAVFNLKTGDRLRTVMEEKMLKDLEDEPGKTFFGVFA
ncbi:hypothetical protein L3Q82_014692, partial [Scortum barcoo]